MPIYNVAEYSGCYKKTGSLWQYCMDERNDKITDSRLTKFKSRFANNAGNDGAVDVEIAIPLKYVSKFLKTLEMPLINCEINHMLTNTKLYVPVLILSIQSNTKLLKHLKARNHGQNLIRVL